jgi:hypothetical protein
VQTAEFSAPSVTATETVTAEASVNADTGKATAEIDAETVTKALADALQAIETAKAGGETNVVAEVKISVAAARSETAVTSVEADIPAAALKAVADAKDIILTVESAVSTVTFDTAALAGIALGAGDGDTVKIALTEVVDKTAELNAGQLDKAGDNSVFDLNVTVGSRTISEFGGIVTVSVPYTPKPEMAAADYDLLTVYHLDDDGDIDEMKGARYDAASQTISFTTDHFSKFFVSEWISPFMDIAKGDWFYKSARFAYSNDLIAGTAEATFAPQSNLTRAMLVTILHRNEGSPSASGTAFSDVPADRWYTGAITWASANGIVGGVGDGLFAPDENVTREQFAAILFNYAKFKGRNVGAAASLAAYGDAAEVSDWAANALSWAVGEKLITGRDATTLAPRGETTRAEAAALLQRYIESLG